MISVRAIECDSVQHILTDFVLFGSSARISVLGTAAPHLGLIDSAAAAAAAADRRHCKNKSGMLCSIIHVSITNQFQNLDLDQCAIDARHRRAIAA